MHGRNGVAHRKSPRDLQGVVVEGTGGDRAPQWAPEAVEGTGNSEEVACGAVGRDNDGVAVTSLGPNGSNRSMPFLKANGSIAPQHSSQSQSSTQVCIITSSLFGRSCFLMVGLWM